LFLRAEALAARAYCINSNFPIALSWEGYVSCVGAALELNQCNRLVDALMGWTAEYCLNFEITDALSCFVQKHHCTISDVIFTHIRTYLKGPPERLLLLRLNQGLIVVSAFAVGIIGFDAGKCRDREKNHCEIRAKDDQEEP
jgi:hypothetical protein